MEKWADYCISAVRYDNKKTHIDKVEVREDLGDKVGAPEEWSREKVVSALENGDEFVTIFKNNKGNYDKGQKVEIIKVNTKKYIRTNRNKVASDNLENLPTF